MSSALPYIIIARSQDTTLPQFIKAFVESWTEVLFSTKRRILDLYLQGLKNDLKAAMDKVDAQYLNELSMGSSGSSASSAYNVHFRVAGIAEDDMPVCKAQKENLTGMKISLIL